MKNIKKIICGIIAAVTLFSLGFDFASGKNEFQAAETAPVTVSNEEVSIEETPSIIPEKEIDWGKYGEDVKAYIFIPALGIEYPVLQGEDNSFYLHHNIHGEADKRGCIIFDWETSQSDMNKIIYGHNMKDASMFGTLKQWVDNKVNVDDDPYIFIYFPDGSAHAYQVCAMYATVDGSFTYNNPTTDAAYATYVKYMSEQSNYSSQDEKVISSLNNQEEIITLSTCIGAGTNQRNIVHAVCVE